MQVVTTELAPKTGKPLAQKALKTSGPGGANPRWVNLGPSRADYEINGSVMPGAIDSGRVAAIVVHPTQPNIIYVASAQGGVWKTTDGGGNWSPITDSLPSLSVGSLEMDPFDTNTLYLGLGDPFDGLGIGFFKSSDAGSTWSGPVVLNGVVGQTQWVATVIKQILASPIVPGLLLAATDVGIFRSLDAGQTWTLTNVPTVPTAVQPMIWSLARTGGHSYALSLVNSGMLGGGGEVYVSADDGTNWARATGITKPSGVARISLAAAPSNRQIVYALAADSSTYNLADIFRSGDGGHTWTALNADLASLTNPNPDASSMAELLGTQGWYNQMVLVSPTDPNTVFFGGGVLLAKTTDGGNTFSQLSSWLGKYGLPYVHADFHCGVFNSAGDLFVGNDGGIFKSTSAGQYWTSALNIGIVSHLLNSVGSSLANPSAVIGGMQDNGTRLRYGATSTFNQVIGGDGFGSHIHPTNANRMLGSLYLNQIYRSSDAGLSFLPASSGIESNFQFFTRIVPSLGDPTGNTVFTLTLNKVFKSTDYASNWVALGTTGLPDGENGLRNIGVSKSNPNAIGLVASLSRVYLSHDGGNSWSLAAALPGSGNALSSIWFDTTNAETIYVTSVALSGTVNHLWKSTDGGASWTAPGGIQAGLPSIPINIVMNDPTNPQRLYAGTPLGVYQSDDGGNVWTRAGTGLPAINVTDIYVSPDASIVRLATYGRGFWELTPTLTISPLTLPNGALGSTYPPQQLTASGATGPYVFTISVGALPPGLGLMNSGVIVGTPVVAGTFSFTVTAIDITHLGTAGSQTYTITISNPKTSQTISFGPLLDRTLGDPDFAVSATATSGGTVIFSSKTTQTCSVNGNLVHLQAGGNCSIAANEPGNAAYDPAPEIVQNFLITAFSKLPQTISFGSLPNRTLGDPDFAVSATATSGGTVIFSSKTTQTCSVNGNLVHLLAVGNCTIAANEPGNAAYNAAPEIVQFFLVNAPDTTPPTVAMLLGDNLSPTMADLLSYTLTFSEGVTGLTASHFILTTSGLSGGAVTSVDSLGGLGDTWTVTINTGRGNGSLHLDFSGGTEIHDLAGNPMVPVSISGETYQIDKGGTVIGTGQGRPDVSFANGGTALFSNVPVVIAPEVAVLSDGRILAAGQMACDANTFLCSLQLARYLTNGAKDASFGQNGQTLTSASQVAFIIPPLVNDDGSFFVVGSRRSGVNANIVAFVAKFTTDGNAASTFGANGFVSLDAIPLGSGLVGAAVDTSGRIIIVGSSASVPIQGRDVIVIRLTSSGGLDPSFGNGGIAKFAISVTGTRLDRAIDVLIQTDGKIVIGGGTVGISNTFDYLLLRLDAGGALDPSFGTGGIVTTRLSASGANIGRQLLVQADGKLLLFGSVSGVQTGVARFTPTGALDAAFGTGGRLLLPILQNFIGAALQPDGKLLLSGINFDAELSYAAFVRLLPDFTLDPGFGSGGLLSITSYDIASRPAVSPNGKIITSLTIEDPLDGQQKSYVTQLATQVLRPTTTTITAILPASSTLGQPYSVAVLVTATGGTPDGPVSVVADTGESCTVVALFQGAGSCILVSTAVGSRTITAAYTGNSTFLGSAGTSLYSVTQAPSISLVSVHSRKTHGTAGDFSLPIAVSPGGSIGITVEPRAIGTGDRIIFSFSNTVVSLGSVTATDSSGGILTATPTISGSEISVLLNGAVDRRTVTIMLSGVNSLLNVSVYVTLFAGDVDGNNTINAGDLSAIKARAGQVTDNSNFIFDLNASGTISASDISAVKARKGLP